MNDGLADSLGHNSWSTDTLLDACADLTADQLDASVPGVHGGIAATFNHLLRSEGSYYKRLSGEEPGWHATAAESMDVDDFRAWNSDLSVRWERFLETPFDGERLITIPWMDHQRDVPAGVFLAQAIHHGTDHRSQICTILTSLGIEPPPIGVWDYAEATERAKRTSG